MIDIDTELWHAEGTTVESIALRVWMPPEESDSTDVALVSPVEGDSSPAPSVSLYTPERPGTTIEITDLDDLADETIDTVELLVRPGPDSGPTLAIDSTIELSGDGGYTLDGQLELEFPSG